jgi:hypothetical protein
MTMALIFLNLSLIWGGVVQVKLNIQHAYKQGCNNVPHVWRSADLLVVRQLATTCNGKQCDLSCCCCPMTRLNLPTLSII